MPVSYTHLDVYKRQDSGLGGGCCPGGGAQGRLRPRPVGGIALSHGRGTEENHMQEVSEDKKIDLTGKNKVLLIYNPKSGSGMFQSHLDKIVAKFQMCIRDRERTARREI